MIFTRSKSFQQVSTEDLLDDVTDTDLTGAEIIYYVNDPNIQAIPLENVMDVLPDLDPSVLYYIPVSECTTDPGSLLSILQASRKARLR